MKKISLLFALLTCMSIGKTFAGYFRIMNLTGCSFEFYSGLGTVTDPVTGTLYGFQFGPITANTGTTDFANPSLLPGLYTNAPANLLASGCVDGIKVYAPGGVAFHLVNTSPYNSYPSTNNPACNGGNNYMASWNANGCDVIIYIF